MPRPLFADSNASTSTRMQNTLDGGAPCYNVYMCADGKWISVACIEPKFYEIFLEKFMSTLPSAFLQRWGTEVPTIHEQMDRNKWPRTRAFFEGGFQCYTRKQWEDTFAGMLSFTEAKYVFLYNCPRYRVRCMHIPSTQSKGSSRTCVFWSYTLGPSKVIQECCNSTSIRRFPAPSTRREYH